MLSPGCPAFNGISAFSRRSQASSRCSYYGEVGLLQRALVTGCEFRAVIRINELGAFTVIILVRS